MVLIGKINKKDSYILFKEKDQIVLISRQDYP